MQFFIAHEFSSLIDWQLAQYLTIACVNHFDLIILLKELVNRHHFLFIQLTNSLEN